MKNTVISSVNFLQNRLLATTMLICCAFAALPAQNTIGGQAKIVPEEEVTRQSAFLEAEKERMLGRHDKAVELYKKFLYDNERISAAWYGLARSYYAANQLPEAIDAMGKAIAIEPENEWMSMFQADLYEKSGRIKDALKIYENLARRNPQSADHWKKTAYLYLLSKEPQDAAKALDKAEKITGVSEEISLKKHLIYFNLGDNKKAAAELQRLADAFPSDLSYRRRLAQFYEQIGDKAALRRTYEDILRRDPQDPVARIAVLEQTKNTSDAAYLQSLLPLFRNPQIALDAKIKEAMPYLLKIEKGLDNSAVSALIELGAAAETVHADDPKAWSLSGDILYLANQPDRALEKYKRCISLKPTVFSVWDNTLSILALQKNYEELYTMSEKAIDAFPNQPKAYMAFGVAATEKGLYDEALTQLEQAFLMCGANNGLRLDVTEVYAAALIKKKSYAAAIARLESALAKGGDKHPGILERLGDAHAYSGNADNAMSYWQKAYAIRKSKELEQKIASGKI